VTNEIDSNTLMGCGFQVAKGEPATSEQGPKNPLPLLLVHLQVALLLMLF